MPVLKQHQNTPAMREAIVLDLGDIGAQAARIRATAEAQASQIITAAHTKSQALALEIHEKAEQEGYAAGLEKGHAEGREQGRSEALAEAAAQLQQITAAWSQVAEEWEQQRNEMHREARQAVLEFALGVAEKLVHRVVQVDETVVVDQAAQALSMVLSSHDATLSMHPVDRPLLEDAMPQLLQELSNLRHVELAEDETITPGGCVVSFGQGRIDATIERQMQRLVNMILPAPPQLPAETVASQAKQMPQQQPVPAEPESDGEAATHDALAAQPNDALPSAPVYEITDDGLVESQPSLPLPPAPPDATYEPSADMVDGLLDTPSVDGHMDPADEAHNETPGGATNEGEASN